MVSSHFLLTLILLLPALVSSYSPNFLSLRRKLRVDEMNAALPSKPLLPSYLHPALSSANDRVKRGAGDVLKPGEETVLPPGSAILPQNPSRQEEEEEEEEECYFKRLRKTDDEKKPRPAVSKVGKCGGELRRMSELIEEHYPNQHGSPNSAALVLARGKGEYIDWSDPNKVEVVGRRFICFEHERELGSDWENQHWRHFKTKQIAGRRTPRYECSMPIFFQHATAEVLKSEVHFIEAAEAEAILKKNGVLLHPGLPICPAHELIARKTFAQAIVERTGYDIRPPPINGDFSKSPVISRDINPFFDKRDPDDPSYLTKHRIHPMKDFSVAVSDAKKQTAYTTFAKDIGVPPHISTAEWFELSDRSQRRQAEALRHINEVVASVMNPDNPQALIDKAFKSPTEYERPGTEQFEQMMLYVKEAVYASNSRSDRLAFLSMVCHFKLPLIQRYIPGLSRYLYVQAKRFARRGYHLEPRDNRRIKYSFEKVERFIEFITSYKVTIGLPYGVRRVRNSHKRWIEIPNTLRKLRAGEIYHLYKKELSDRDELHMLLAESTARKMIAICKAETRKSLHGVDIIVADAMDAFDSMEDFLDERLAAKDITQSWHDHLRMRMLQGRQYLRTDYNVHTKKYSSISDHCWTHALSDPDDLAFQMPCSIAPRANHKHSRVCDQCESVQIFKGDLLQTVIELEENSKGDKEKEQQAAIWRRDYHDWEEKIDKLKAHQLRTAKAEDDREKIIKELKMNEGDVLLTLDFAMKHLPLQPRESTVDWYAQRGMTWHVSHVTTSKGGDFYQHNFVHIFTGERQDSATVTAVLRHDLKQLKEKGIKRVFLRSDQAGCYKSSSTLSSVRSIADEVGIEVIGWYFSEAQAGKGPCDLCSARVLDPTQFYDVVTGGRLLDGISFYLVSLEGSGSSKKPTLSDSKIEDLSKLNAFTFEEKNLRVQRYWNIGSGKTVSYKNLRANDAKLKVLKSGGALGDDIFWQKMGDARYPEEAKDDKDYEPPEMNDANDDVDEPEEKRPKMPKIESTLYRCDVENCGKEFISELNLEKHKMVGKHLNRAEKPNALDFALDRFSAFLEMAMPPSSCPIIDDVAKSMTDGNNDNGRKLDMGWALPQRRRSSRFPPEVKTFLKNLYDEGERTGVKVDARQAAALMRAARKTDGSMQFPLEHLLNSRQIAGVYTGFKKTKLDKRDRATNRASRVKRSGEEEGEPDEVNDLFNIEGDPELEYKTEPLFDHTDVFREAISKKHGELFSGVEPEEYRGWLGPRKC